MKLYEIKEEGMPTQYGSLLAINSSGKMVMEIKSTGEVIAVDPSSVEEVLPYTISVSFGKGQLYHYLAPKGVYKVGDVCVLDAPLGRGIVNVVDVDTKSKSATVEFKPLIKLGKI